MPGMEGLDPQLMYAYGGDPAAIEYQNSVLQYLADNVPATLENGNSLNKQVLKMIETQNDLMDMIESQQQNPPAVQETSGMVYMMGGILLGFIGGLFTANYLMQSKLQAKNKNKNGAKSSQGTELKSPSKKKGSGKESDPDENTRFL